MNLQTIEPEKIKELIADLEAESNEDKLASYKPYPKQAEFHEAGAKHRERLLMAGNQLGKTLAGAFETAMHLTGRYPEWWKGKRFDCSIMAWAGGDRGTTVRDTVQAKLVGPADAIGTGTIPKDALLELVPAHGVSGLLDTIRVRHVSGGVSTLGFKTYESGREKWQGTTLQFVWLDEEPPFEIYSEALTRTNIGNNPVILTFTPLLGVSETVRRFLHDPSPDRHVSQMTIDDVKHYSPEEKARIIASYAEHELRPGRKAFRLWALAGCSGMRRISFWSIRLSVRRIGPESVGSILVGRTMPRSVSCGGTAISTSSTWFARCGLKSRHRSNIAKRCGIGTWNGPGRMTDATKP